MGECSVQRVGRFMVRMGLVQEAWTQKGEGGDFWHGIVSHLQTERARVIMSSRDHVKYRTPQPVCM